jgi:hypothetical protein
MHPSIPASSPSASTSGIEVTLSWTDGRLDSRRIYRFAGTLSSLAIVARPGAEPELINVDRLAYVAFPRSPVQAGRAAVAPAGSVQVRVHVDPGKQFLVWALPTDLRRDATGFFGTPVGLSPFDRIFFYSHAVDLIENDALLGDMLVEDGKVAPEALAAAVAAQNPRIGQLLVDQKRISSHALESALELQRRKRIPLGDVLLQEGLIQPGDLEEALAAQKASRNRRLGDVLVQQGFIDERSLAHTLGRKFHLPVVDLAEVSIDPESLNGIPADAMRRHQFLPLRQDERTVVVAVATVVVATAFLTVTI